MSTELESTMQLEGAEGEAHRRELAAKRAMRRDDAVPVSSIPRQIRKPKPLRYR